MKVDTRNLRHWRLLFCQGLYTLLAILLRPFVSPPAKPLVLLYGHQFNGNLKALYDEWALHGPEDLQLAYLTLDPAQYATLRAKGITALGCFRWRDMRHLAGCSAMITDHGLHALVPLLHLTNIRFIDVWHGIPFKGFAPDDFRLQQRYDEVWVSSAFMKTLYADRFGFNPEKVHALGYARTDKLFQRPVPESSYRKQAGIPAEQKLVLYAPTWRQDDAGRELFPFGCEQAEFTEELAKTCADAGAILVIRSHLNAAINCHNHDYVRYCSQRDYSDTEDLLLGTDILICDWSSIAFDFLALDRPTLFLDVPAPFKHGLSLGPEYRFGCVISDMEALKVSLKKYLISPSSYFSKHATSHSLVTRKIYGNSSIENIKKIQLNRIARLTLNAENEN